MESVTSNLREALGDIRTVPVPEKYQDTVLCQLRGQKGSARLVNEWYNDFYGPIAKLVRKAVQPRPMGFLYLDSLKNGGLKGEGLAILKRAIELANGSDYTLVVPAKSSGDQEKLIAWYESTGLLTRVPGSDVFYA